MQRFTSPTVAAGNVRADTDNNEDRDDISIRAYYKKIAGIWLSNSGVPNFSILGECSVQAQAWKVLAMFYFVAGPKTKVAPTLLPHEKINRARIFGGDNMAAL